MIVYISRTEKTTDSKAKGTFTKFSQIFIQTSRGERYISDITLKYVNLWFTILLIVITCSSIGKCYDKIKHTGLQTNIQNCLNCPF